jgi:hypothetical protein
MMRSLRPNRRTRLRLTLLAVFALLFQQVALASYVCASADVPAANAAMHLHCDGMPMAQQKQAPALCAQHCARQASATQDARLPNVPPLLMPALLPAPPTVVASPVASAPHVRSAAWRTSGIPPALRFRVLLI